ncbi:META domain-containing protein [Arenibacterium sp. CAU 1754]
MLRNFAILSLICLPACRSDETLTGYGASGVVWTLAEMDGRRFAARATLRFPEPGQIAGNAPCNAYSGKQTAPYPWFQAENIAATHRACPDLAAENAFFSALSAMTLAEVGNGTLILSTETGREMVFTAAE